ncbi:hypothetical protein ES288_A04G051800v1 [Gossypium darwinii]|uniref:Uncharacterized protein n=1 Tax=Gossypium darwinii TaxID=34276 RepID=A0A5D2GV00_GOSDA|nr:hypothetical protein ES288_A04G051800v1 [Gossypium darwinii]
MFPSLCRPYSKSYFVRFSMHSSTFLYCSVLANAYATIFTLMKVSFRLLKLSYFRIHVIKQITKYVNNFISPINYALFFYLDLSIAQLPISCSKLKYFFFYQLL